MLGLALGQASTETSTSTTAHDTFPHHCVSHWLTQKEQDLVKLMLWQTAAQAYWICLCVCVLYCPVHTWDTHTQTQAQAQHRAKFGSSANIHGLLVQQTQPHMHTPQHVGLTHTCKHQLLSMVGKCVCVCVCSSWNKGSRPCIDKERQQHWLNKYFIYGYTMPFSG